MKYFQFRTRPQDRETIFAIDQAVENYKANHRKPDSTKLTKLEALAELIAIAERAGRQGRHE